MKWIASIYSKNNKVLNEGNTMKKGDYVKTKNDIKISLNGYIIGLGCTYEIEDVWESYIKLKGVPWDVYHKGDDFEIVRLEDAWDFNDCGWSVHGVNDYIKLPDEGIYTLDPNQPEDMTSSDYYHGYKDFDEDNLSATKFEDIGPSQQKGVIYNSCGYSFKLTEDELKWVSSGNGLKTPSAEDILRRRELKAEIEKIENKY